MAKTETKDLQQVNNDVRAVLLDIIFDHSRDEFESVDDVMELAKENEYELLDRIINLLDFYRDERNS